MGLEVSKDEKTLWVSTTSMTNYEDYVQSEDGFASVLKYDLKNGKLLETFALPGGHNFGDLISDDKVLVSADSPEKANGIAASCPLNEYFHLYVKEVK